VALDFLDDVLLLYLPLEPAQRVFERLAFLNANLCQEIPPPNLPKGFYYDTGNFGVQIKLYPIYLAKTFSYKGFRAEQAPSAIPGPVWCCPHCRISKMCECGLSG
jgi:hypothetical protein